MPPVAFQCVSSTLAGISFLLKFNPSPFDVCFFFFGVCLIFSFRSIEVNTIMEPVPTNPQILRTLQLEFVSVFISLVRRL